MLRPTDAAKSACDSDVFLSSDYQLNTNSFTALEFFATVYIVIFMMVCFFFNNDVRHIKAELAKQAEMEAFQRAGEAYLANIQRSREVRWSMRRIQS